MRKTLNMIGCCLVVGGMVLMIGAAGMSDTGSGLDSVLFQLVTGLVMLGLGSLAARLAQIQRRDNH